MWNSSTKAVAAIAAAGLALYGGMLLRDADGAQTTVKPAVFFNLTSGKEDLHAVTMALQLAGHALDDGRDVTLFFNVRAPVLACKDLSEKVAFHGNPPIKTMIAALRDRGAEVVVCPHCMQVQGVVETELIPGAKVATRELVFGKLGPQTAVFSY